MPAKYLLSPLALTLLTAYAQADESAEEGFIEGANLNVHTRNYYFNRDRRQNAQNSQEWG